MTNRAFIQAVRRFCPNCKKVVNPLTEIENESERDDEEVVTTTLTFRCMGCNTIVGRAKVD